uniref:UBA domain-containing protein n=1 Tax=Gossypium raimondii TaxID=29730 RepID=A0A0D2SFR0_GOSRA|nr:hypothetical protein B456_005G130000 [Gossypium raimondii]
MAGVSLKCGDCGALLKSVEEAQEHAELTSHSNFSESTEAVLNLVCSSCGKPCRSKIESDLHTKRTGHTEFIDKTLEAAKPISLEVPKVAKESEEAIAAGSTSEPEEMVVPEVDKKLLEELEAMGFPTARATRAIHFSGNTSLEAAVNWVVEHEADPDIDQMPMVPVNRHVEASKPSLTPEEMKLKAQELRRGFEWARSCWKQNVLKKKMKENVWWPCGKLKKRKRNEHGKRFVRNWRKIRQREGGSLGCHQRSLQQHRNLLHPLWRRKRAHCQLGLPQRLNKCANVCDPSSKITRMMMRKSREHSRLFLHT